MMLAFAEYAETGEILRSGHCPASDMAAQGERVLWVPAPVDDRAYIVVDGQLAERPELPIVQDRGSVGVGELVSFADLPAGTEVKYAGKTVAVKDGLLEWSSGTPGKYRLRFRKFPYRELVMEVEVVS